MLDGIETWTFNLHNEVDAWDTEVAVLPQVHFTACYAKSIAKISV